jgi:hypothetical protein
VDQSQVVAMLTTVIGNVGFPIAVTGYLLLRFEKKLDILTNAMQDFKIAVKEESEKKND